eukprot:5794543-Amphidinium_carterae.1
MYSVHAAVRNLQAEWDGWGARSLECDVRAKTLYRTQCMRCHTRTAYTIIGALAMTQRTDCAFVSHG